MHALGSLRQKHGSLSRRIASTHDNNLFTAAQLCFHESRAVVNTQTFELGQVLDGRLPIGGAGCDDNRARLDSKAVIHFNGVWQVVALEMSGALRDHHLRPKLLRLHVCASRESLTRNACGKAE